MFGPDDTFTAGDHVRLADGREGVVVRQVRDQGFSAHIVRITSSVDARQVGMTVGATPTYMRHVSSFALAGRVLRVALAMTPTAHAQGLQDVAPLGLDEGLLFVWPNEAPRTFHMGRVAYPIDIIWIAHDGRVTKVVSATPGQRDAWTAKAATVLETRHGAMTYDPLRTMTEASTNVQVTEPGPALLEGEPGGQGTPGVPMKRRPVDNRFQHSELPDTRGPELDPGHHYQETMGRDPSRDPGEGESSGGNRMSAGLIVELEGAPPRLMPAVVARAWGGRVAGAWDLEGRKVRGAGGAGGIVDPVAFASALVDALSLGAGRDLRWQPNLLNGVATDSVHVTRNEVTAWFRRLGVSDLSTVIESAITPEGFDIIGDTFVLAGMADLARMDRDRRGITLFRRHHAEILSA